MKKSIAIFLLSVYLFSATDVKELLKINVVLTHFSEHQKKDNSLTLIHFLVMHYVTDDNNSQDNDRDNQLPFKSPDSFTANNSLVFLTIPFLSSTIQSLPDPENIFLTTNIFFNYRSFHSIVWHPPQFS